MSPRALLPRPCLALVTDRHQCRGLALSEAVAQAVAGGANVVQVREKDLPQAQLLALSQHLRAVTQGRALLLINSRPDVAVASRADGLHLPEEGLDLRTARHLVGEGMLIGRSVHSVASAVAAAADGADYLIVGTIFASPSHPGGPVAGLPLLTEVRRSVSIPVLAIGGISAANVGDVMRAGADGCAVISAILASHHPRQAATALLDAMTAARARLAMPQERS